MEPTVPTSARTSKPGSRIFLIITAIIVVLILAFLVMRPNPSGVSPKNGSSTPAPASSQ